MNPTTIVLAGASGNLGGRIARELRRRQARVRALVRKGTAPDGLERLRALGVEIMLVDLGSRREVEEACRGGSCVVSALAGLRDAIVDAQAGLVEGAVEAGVPRFVPSDYSIDFSRLPAGRNRNLDLRREFHELLDRADIRATTVFCGAFAELVTGQMPLVLFKLRRVVYWGSADQRMDFTTMDDAAAFTANAALDPTTPRFLRIAGDESSARELTAAASEVTGTRFRLLRAGSLGTLGALIRLARLLAPGRGQLYPAWQGMQYMRDMFDGRAKLEPLDNDRYPDMRWTSVRNVLAAHASR